MLISVVKNREFEYSKMGIDMSAAFDTIKRRTVLKLLQQAGCTDDEVRLVRYLLSNTRLQVRVKNELSVYQGSYSHWSLLEPSTTLERDWEDASRQFQKKDSLKIGRMQTMQTSRTRRWKIWKQCSLRSAAYSLNGTSSSMTARQNLQNST